MQHMKLISWNKRKIWKPKQYKIHFYHTTYYSCSYVVNSVHEYFVETDFHLQISHQARSKHENVTVSYHSWTTLLPHNLLQLQLHFSCTFYNINNVGFTKIRVSWNGGLPLHIRNFKMFVTQPNFEWGYFSWPKFDLGCSNLPKYL